MRPLHLLLPPPPPIRIVQTWVVCPQLEPAFDVRQHLIQLSQSLNIQVFLKLFPRTKFLQLRPLHFNFTDCPIKLRDRQLGSIHVGRSVNEIVTGITSIWIIIIQRPFGRLINSPLIGTIRLFAQQLRQQCLNLLLPVTIRIIPLLVTSLPPITLQLRSTRLRLARPLPVAIRPVLLVVLDPQEAFQKAIPKLAQRTLHRLVATLPFQIRNVTLVGINVLIEIVYSLAKVPCRPRRSTITARPLHLPFSATHPTVSPPFPPLPRPLDHR